MIILAAAIILSLNSAGIIGKANQAKTDTNDKQLLEAASLHLAEYELAVKTGDASVEGKDAESYVREKLDGDNFSQADINRVTVVDGEIVLEGAGGSTPSIADKIAALNVPVGTPVNGYALTAKTYKTSGNENNGTEQELATVTTLTWKYGGVDSDGDAIIIADIPATLPVGIEMRLTGMNGVLNGPTELNNACAELYTTAKGEGRCLSKADVEKIGAGNNIFKTTYTYSEEQQTPLFDSESWLCDTYIWDESPNPNVYDMYTIKGTTGLIGQWSIGTADGSTSNGFKFPFRPVVELNDSVNVSYADGVLTLN